MRRFGLIGKTLKHSFSKNYFTKKFSDNAINDCSYDLFELQSIDDFPQLLQSIPELHGLNVTIPYKETVLTYLHHLDPVVEEMGACNCISINEGRLTGYNTDYIGFRDTIAPLLKPLHNQALVLGTGGASKAVVYALKKLGITTKLVSREKGKADFVYEELTEEVMAAYRLIVNTTPLGTYPDIDAAAPIPYYLLSPNHFLFDLVYNPSQTLFLKQGAMQGAQTANGENMLVLQAEAAWEIWNR
jgi:shikimate dehydrogenase